MVTLSHDPDAGTLYWYFAEISEGAVALEGECDATLLLDAEGMIIGAVLELDESVRPDDLALALSHAGVRYDEASFALTVMLFDEEPAEEQPLSEVALLDFDGEERMLGFELFPAETFGLATRLERAAALLVAPEVVDEPAIDRSDAVIAEWVRRQDVGEEPEQDEDEEAAPSASTAAEPPTDQALDAQAFDAQEAQPDTGAAEDEPLDEGVGASFGPDDEPEPEAPHMPPPARLAPSPDYRSGFVAIVGRPNVGKSTLLNALLGQKLAIVSPKPQTTRVPLRGILNHPAAQIIFIDTPGIHDPRSKLGTFMVDAAKRAIPDADVVCFIVDITKPPSRLDTQIATQVKRARAPHILVLNKVDATNAQTMDHVQAYRDLGPWAMELAIAARTGEGVAALVDEIVGRLPFGPPLYPEDQVSDQSVRELAAELVREKVLRFTEQEVPHAVAVEVEEWEKREQVTYMRMTVYTEKDSQKSILIGAKGAMLRKIGTAARSDIERAVGGPVYLDLWVKTRSNWRDDATALHWLGYGKRDK